MNAPIYNPDDNDPAGVSDALRRDARRIEEAPFDAALHREAIDRIRDLSATSQPRFRFGLAPALVMAAVASVVIALICVSLLPTHRPQAPSFVQVPIWKKAPPIASVWSYETGLAQGDEVFAGMLDRDARTLLPASSTLPDGLL